MKLYLQYAHHNKDQYDEIDVTSRKQVLDVFDTFDWSGEAQKSKDLKKSYPSLSLEIPGHEKFLWVAGHGEGDDDKEIFSSEYSFPGTVSAWFGLSEKQGTVTLSTNKFSTDEARLVLELFLEENQPRLKRMYSGT